MYYICMTHAIHMCHISYYTVKPATDIILGSASTCEEQLVDTIALIICFIAHLTQIKLISD